MLTMGLLSLSAPVAAQQKWMFELGGGVPFNIPLPLVIRQTGEPDIRLTAQYSSEPFTVPIYWVWRLGYWSNDRCWELQAIHHKIFLRNKPPEVETFGISHGLNLITISRGWELNGYVLKAGAGIVLAHPENTIREKTLSEDAGILHWGYYVSGPTVNLAAGKYINMTKNLFADCEAIVSASYALVPIADGTAEVYNIAFQITVALGFRIVSGSGE
jgi:hypothetical protein